MYFELYGTHKFVSEFKVKHDSEGFKLMIGFIDGVQAHFMTDENGLITPYSVGIKDADKDLYFSGPLVDGSAITMYTLNVYLENYYPALSRVLYGEPVMETVVEKEEEY